MRFDDSLKTVLAADTATAFGAQSAFRQLVDLLGRRRILGDPDHIERLRALRQHVPAGVRASCARALALAVPEAPLVAFFAEDEPSIAAPVLRGVTLTPEAWCGLLSGLGPTGRAVLRSRRDLPAEVMRGLDSFGSVDFSLPGPTMTASAAVNQPTPPAQGTGPFVALGEVARKLPVVEEALRHAADAGPASPPATAPHFEISDLVARIAAYQKDRTLPEASPSDVPSDRFDFETDADGVICWVGAGVRGALIGLSLTGLQGDDGHVVDGVVAGAFRRRSAFRDARLTVGGASAMTGPWRVSAVPCFDEHSGRFTGFRGLARRPRADESAAPRRSVNVGASESLRRLVHELRTPTNAIAGFSELIETELMGPIDPRYRDRAHAIRLQAGDLIAAIEDLDIAARIAGDTLELRPGQVDAGAVIRSVIRDLEPLAILRGARITLAASDISVTVAGDDRAVERLIARLLSAIVSAAGPDEAIDIKLRREDGMIAVDVDRPVALAGIGDDALLRIDAESEAAMPGAPLLGTGFALRLARNLATELGGELVLAARRLTLRLPAVLDVSMGQASTH